MLRNRSEQQTKQKHIENQIELDKARISLAEYEYSKRPKENIKELIQFDYQDYTDWRKLPPLITC